MLALLTNTRRTLTGISEDWRQGIEALQAKSAKLLAWAVHLARAHDRADKPVAFNLDQKPVLAAGELLRATWFDPDDEGDRLVKHDAHEDVPQQTADVELESGKAVRYGRVSGRRRRVAAGSMEDLRGDVFWFNGGQVGTPRGV
ncbi:hypothetical protein IVB38_28080 [Bradyrhizobium sp. 38]|uniref:hypothetical protein n=1 Tax=unclassified Bradyrhizobium TaxID=2631580 RepID=UPI001FF8A8C1|nr:MULTISPECIES: hypothetical protein [unclassified Bradyrhizobium]MCK1339758.1 hypothetical protein [Bradyrhizobium sp. 38]MCK1777977.1 hypothetical protein [Bradyrhizobium sp. 132]